MTVRPDAPPSSTRHYLGLAFGTLGTMFDVALVVLGSVLLGLAVAVVLDGFDLVTIGLDLSTGGMLGSGLVIGIIGGFALGIASEGPLGRGRRLVGHTEVEIAAGRAIAAVVVALALVVARDLLAGFVTDLPRPFGVAVQSMQAVANAGMTVVPLIGVPLAWWARTGMLGRAAAVDGDIPVLYFVWAITTMIFL